jgi:hypothetical protein
MVSAALAAILALPGGPGAPVVAALTAPLLARMAERAAAEWGRKTSVVAETALSTAGIADPEAFCDVNQRSWHDRAGPKDSLRCRRYRE